MVAAVLEDNDWSADAVATIIALSHAQQIVTAEDLRREIRTPPHSNMFGAAFSAARSQGFIEASGYTTSNTPSRHHGVIRTWRRKVEGVQS
jgi:adenosine/AMP kinase